MMTMLTLLSMYHFLLYLQVNEIFRLMSKYSVTQSQGLEEEGMRTLAGTQRMECKDGRGIFQLESGSLNLRGPVVCQALVSDSIPIASWEQTSILLPPGRLFTSLAWVMVSGLWLCPQLTAQ